MIYERGQLNRCKIDFIKILLADTTFTFAAEIVLRSVLMYFLIILVLRFSGKRGVRQLSIFEIAIILSLGSAAGDAMFYEVNRTEFVGESIF